MCRYELVKSAVAVDFCTMVKAFTGKDDWEEEEWFELHYDLIGDIFPEAMAIVATWVVGQVLCLSIPIKWEDNLNLDVSTQRTKLRTVPFYQDL